MDIKCGSESRRSLVKNHETINGIDFIEIRTLQNPDNSYPNPLIFVHCFKDLNNLLNNQNVIISGGVRVTDVEAQWVYTAKDFSILHSDLVSDAELKLITAIEEPEKTLVIRSTFRGDFSKYTLLLVESREFADKPANGFDLLLSKMEFSFAVECPRDIDCTCQDMMSRSILLPEPAIDYMVKDYASFRKLILDRISLLIPEWKERNPSDFGMAIIELLAYVGDHLSYYQDAVATETYLGTARSRISASRHARLLDYHVNNGSNARAWVCFEVNGDNVCLEKRRRLLTKTDDLTSGTVVEEIDIEDEIAKGAEVFETMYDVTFFESKNKLCFYTWSETDCWLPEGSTSATIINKEDLSRIDIFIWEKIPDGTNIPNDETDKLTNYLKENFGLNWIETADINKSNENITFSNSKNTITLVLNLAKDNVILRINEQAVYQFEVDTIDSDQHLVLAYCLGVGDILIFQEKNLSDIDNDNDDNNTGGRCHAVRLKLVTTGKDELTDQNILELEWDQDDALPFSMCIAKDGSPASIIYGNVVLVDHGYSTNEKLENTIIGGRYYPKISKKPLTYLGTDFNPKVYTENCSASARSAFTLEKKQYLPKIHLILKDNNYNPTWNPAHDLLSTDEFSRKFVVEIENDGTAYLRFNTIRMINWASIIERGESINFEAKFRIGNGIRGNVGPRSISRILLTKPDSITPTSIQCLTNPMTAEGGEEQETLASINQFAPQSFRKQERAVTAEDYEHVLKRHPQVYRAVAEKRWTGSWYTMFVTIDRKGSLEVNDEFKKEIVDFFEKYRLAGYDVEVQSPIYVPLEIELEICLKKGYFSGEIKNELIKAFSSNMLENGRKGFFHPDNFTFGQPLYLSKIYQVAMSIDGISSVVVKTFKRWGKAPNGELDEGVIKTSIQEIVRLDNNPNFSENGMINFIFCGGDTVAV